MELLVEMDMLDGQTILLLKVEMVALQELLALHYQLGFWEVEVLHMQHSMVSDQRIGSYTIIPCPLNKHLSRIQ